MDIIVYKTKVKILVSNKSLNKEVQCLNCFGLVIDYSEKDDYYTVEFEYITNNGEIDTEIVFLKRNEFVVLEDS